MALQTQQIDIANPQHVRIGSAVWNMAGRAAFDLDRLVFEDEWPLFIGMAGKTDRILCRRGPYLLRPASAVHIVAVRTLHQSLIHAMVERHFELRLLLQMAGVTKLGLRFYQQKLFGLRMVRRMARDATHIVLRVYRVDGIHVLRATGMTSQTAGVNFLRRSVLEYKNLGFVSAPSHMVRARPMAAFASLTRWTTFGVEGRLPVRRLLPPVVNFLVTRLARLRTHEFRSFGRGCSGRLRGCGRCAGGLGTLPGNLLARCAGSKGDDQEKT